MAVGLAWPSAPAAAKRPAYMQEAKPQSITVNSNVAKATVMEDGLFVGHAGAPFDATPGPHELLVSAAGYVPRLIRVNVTGQAVVQTVNLAPSQAKGEEVELDFKAAGSFKVKRTLDSVPSLCAAYNRAPAKVSPDLILSCHRETLVDDLDHLGYSWLGGTWLGGTEQSAASPGSDASNTVLLQDVNKARDESFYWRAEERYAAAPGDALAATLVSFSAASRGDCGRVFQVAVEHGAYQRPAPGLNFVRGICFELAGQPDKAARLYLLLANAKLPPPDVLYHLARVQNAVAPQSAVRTLKVCTKAHPAHYPCYEAMAHTQVIAGNLDDAKATMSLYRKRTRSALAKVFASDKLDPAVVRAAFAERPESFELAAAAAIVDRLERGSDLQRVPLSLENRLITEPAIVKQLLPLLEDSVAADTLTPVYIMLTRYLPKDPIGWIRLASAYRVGDRCTESLEATQKALALLQDVYRKAALKVSSTECLVRLDRLTEAEEVLTQVTAAGDPSWKAFYNLAVVQERLGKRSEALRNFELALTGDMPPAVRSRVEAKLGQSRAEQLSRGQTSETSRQDLPAAPSH